MATRTELSLFAMSSRLFQDAVHPCILLLWSNMSSCAQYLHNRTRLVMIFSYCSDSTHIHLHASLPWALQRHNEHEHGIIDHKINMHSWSAELPNASNHCSLWSSTSAVVFAINTCFQIGGCRMGVAIASMIKFRYRKNLITVIEIKGIHRQQDQHYRLSSHIHNDIYLPDTNAPKHSIWEDIDFRCWLIPAVWDTVRSGSTKDCAPADPVVKWFFGGLCLRHWRRPPEKSVSGSAKCRITTTKPMNHATMLLWSLLGANCDINPCSEGVQQAISRAAFTVESTPKNQQRHTYQVLTSLHSIPRKNCLKRTCAAGGQKIVIMAIWGPILFPSADWNASPESPLSGSVPTCNRLGLTWSIPNPAAAGHWINNIRESLSVFNALGKKSVILLRLPTETTELSPQHPQWWETCKGLRNPTSSHMLILPKLADMRRMAYEGLS